jgi:hypothetical protein
MTVTLPDGFHVNGGANGITTNINTASAFSQDPAIQTAVANLVQQFTDPAVPISGSVGISNFAFGVSSTDFVDTFMMMNAAIPASAALTTAKLQTLNAAASVYNSLNNFVNNAVATNTLSLAGIATGGVTSMAKFNSMNFMVTSDKSLQTSMSATAALPVNANINMPYSSINLLVNGQPFVVPVTNFSMVNGNVNMGMDLVFQKNDSQVNNIVYSLNSFLTGTIPSSNLVGSVTGISFGANQASAFNFMSQASVTAPLDPGLAFGKKLALVAANQPAPPVANVVNMFTSINGALTPTGVDFKANMNALKNTQINVPVAFTGKANYIMDGVANNTMQFGSAQVSVDTGTGDVKLLAIPGMYFASFLVNS